MRRSRIDKESRRRRFTVAEKVMVGSRSFLLSVWIEGLVEE